MAKARSKKDVSPKLIFRENGAAKGNRATSLKETNVEMNWVSVSKSQSFKIVFLGDSNVGKTCLARMLVDQEVIDHTTNTIGFDHHVKEVEVREGTVVKLQIWDTAGMEQFRNALITKYYRNADGIVLVFDISRRESFENIEVWVKEVEQYCTGSLERIRMVLVGNKVDLERKRQVTVNEAQNLMRRYKMIDYCELSAKSLSFLPSLEQTFVHLAHQMLSVRETIEQTRSERYGDKDVIQLISDDWEVVMTPEEPVPQYAYKAQDEQRFRLKKCAC